MGDRRLIEAAFPLRQVSRDSVHEKNVRHGHISTLHIWPARRPLAASRAALLATLLPDPGSRDGRRELLERMAGSVVERPDGSGVLRWGREQGREIAAFRQEIRDAFGGRAPRVLDPFAGGGAIPLEAMRLGCEAVAADINPVAWFILRCTLHYPRLLAGQTRHLPAFALRDRSFVEHFVTKGRGVTSPRRIWEELARYGHEDPDYAGGEEQDFASMRSAPVTDADAAWHLRAWGQRVLDGARRELAARYPTYAEFEPARRKGARRNAPRRTVRYRPRPPRLLEPDADGRVSAGAALNAEFDSLYLEDEANPRWVAKPAVAYLWARTVRCRGCQAEIPLLKTRWLCRKASKRVLLTMAPQAGAGVEFGVTRDVAGDDGAGTMNRSGAACPCCGEITTMADIRVEARAGRLGERMTAVIVDGQQGKEYRLPTAAEIEAARVDGAALEALYADIPFGIPDEAIVADRPSPNSGGAAGLPLYGFSTWRAVFTDRQLLTLGVFVRETRRCFEEIGGDYPDEWREALAAYLAPTISRLADRSCAVATWTISAEKIRNAFARFALPMVWDFAESCPLADTTGGFIQAVEWIARVFEHTSAAAAGSPTPCVAHRTAAAPLGKRFDLICTDPPYYDAIPYSDLMDFFHVWLRRTTHGISPETDASFAAPLGPKWDHKANDGELVDQPSRFAGDVAQSRDVYEDGMLRALRHCHDALRDDGRLVVVFANKQPSAWETLVSALIRAGFVVVGSWPIQTERASKVAGGARLSSSIWLVCRKRPAAARPGWDGTVLAEMQEHVTERLRDFWDAGIRGPDFVWAATGPALEAFSRHPVVKQADREGGRLTVAEFLRHVRRMVVGFVVSRLLQGDGGATGELDDPTTYYLLHRNDFGLGAAPAGACILYALSCNVADADLAGRLDLLARGARATPADTGDEGGGRLGPVFAGFAGGSEPSADGPPPLKRMIEDICRSPVESIDLPCSIDCLITSPPYMNALDYGRDNRLRLWFLNESSPDILDRSLASIDNFKSMITILARKLQDKIRSGGYCIFVVGEQVNRTIPYLPSELLIDVFAKQTDDFQLCHIIQDTIPDIRRSRKHNYGGIKTENILVFRKQI